MLEQALKDTLKKYATSDEMLNMMEYCVLDGGKRVRPMLCLLTAEMLGCRTDRALPFAIALELIHSYSLVHDDLPAMDNDDMRRGKLSCHKKYGEAQAILVGDALLTLSALVLSEVEGEQAAKREIFTAAITMVEGQRVDLSEPQRSEELYRKKTGALISAGILSAARLANCTQMQYDRLRIFGDRLGLLFQLTDDVLDNEQNGNEVKARINELTDEARLALDGFGSGAEPLLKLLNKIVMRKE